VKPARELTGWKLQTVRVLAFVAAVAVTLFIFSMREELKQLAGFGYPSIFLLSMISNATLVFPGSSVALTFAFGAVFNPVIVGIVSGLGAAFGELTGYLVGFSGQGIVDDFKIYKQLETWTSEYGGPLILVLAFIPNPLFDLAGVAAGALKMPVSHFLFWCAIGKILKMLVFALAGAASIDWIGDLLPSL
jgi:membrane protein DedA with SNARE-associated domain